MPLLRSLVTNPNRLTRAWRYLINNIDESGSYLRDPNQHYSHQNIELVQQKVDRVDSSTKQVTLANGSSRSYDKLLIATGSRPVSPPIPGLDLPQVSSCWTLADARAIIERAQADANVVLIGAGFIGCIILEALVKRGVKLSVVETGNRMVGASSVGKTQHIGVLRGLIESKLDLSSCKDRLKSDPTQIMEAYLSCTQELGYS